MFIYANIAGYVIVALAGFVLGTFFGHMFTSNAMALFNSVEDRISAIEHTLFHTSASTAHQPVPSPDHTRAVEKLASAIEKHAKAVDEHGAATVAAAIESHVAVSDGKTPAETASAANGR